MSRAGLGFFLLLAFGCSEDVFVATPGDDEAQTEVYLVRSEADEWSVFIRDAGAEALELEAPLEVLVFRYSVERSIVEAWRRTPGPESCGLLGGRAYELRNLEVPSFVEIQASDSQFDVLLPDWARLCVSCRNFSVRSVLLPVPAGDLEDVRSGGPNAPLPSGAFLTTGAPGHGLFRATETEAVPVDGPDSERPSRIHRLADGRYLIAGSTLDLFEIDAAETKLTAVGSLRFDDAIPDNRVLDVLVGPSDQHIEVLLVDAGGRVARAATDDFEVLEIISLPPFAWPTGKSMLWFERDHFLVANEARRLLEWKAGQVRHHELPRGEVASLVHVAGFGVMVGTSQGEVLRFDDGEWQSFGITENADDIDVTVPYRNGFIAVSKGGFIEQYATHLGRFCGDSTPIPGAQNADLAAWTPVPSGFFCSDCLQSRSGGAYGAIWVSEP